MQLDDFIYGAIAAAGVFGFYFLYILILYEVKPIYSNEVSDEFVFGWEKGKNGSPMQITKANRTRKFEKWNSKYKSYKFPDNIHLVNAINYVDTHNLTLANVHKLGYYIGMYSRETGDDDSLFTYSCFWVSYSLYYK